MGDYSSQSAQSAGDSELQDFLMVEKQKAQVNAQVSVNARNRFINVTLYYSCLVG